MGLCRSGPVGQNDVVLFGEKRAYRELTHQPFVGGCVGDVEVVDFVGQRQLGQRDLILDRPGLFLGDFELKQVADDRGRRSCGSIMVSG